MCGGVDLIRAQSVDRGMYMFKYKLLREEDGKYVMDKEFECLEDLYFWARDTMEFQYRKGWV